MIYAGRSRGWIRKLTCTAVLINVVPGIGRVIGVCAATECYACCHCKTWTGFHYFVAVARGPLSAEGRPEQGGSPQRFWLRHDFAVSCISHTRTHMRFLLAAARPQLAFAHAQFILGLACLDRLPDAAFPGLCCMEWTLQNRPVILVTGTPARTAPMPGKGRYVVRACFSDWPERLQLLLMSGFQTIARAMMNVSGRRVRGAFVALHSAHRLPGFINAKRVRTQGVVNLSRILRGHAYASDTIVFRVGMTTRRIWTSQTGSGEGAAVLGPR